MSIVLSMILGATSFTTMYGDGVQAYSNGNFAESVNRFEELIYNRVYEPEVFYNLGNAYYRSGNLALAITNYERALLLESSLQDARENLQRAIAKTKHAFPRPAISGAEAQLYFWHGGLTKISSMRIALFFWFTAWLTLATRIFVQRTYMRRFAAGTFLLAIIFMGSWVLKANPPELAVANGNQIPVRYGNKPSDTTRFELSEGDRVHIDKQNDEWVRVVKSDGERGWARKEHFIKVWPPFNSSYMPSLVPEDD